MTSTSRSRKILVTLHEDEVSPRFDLATEVLVAQLEKSGEVREQRTLVLARASAEALCELILSEGIDTVICGGIEGEYYDFLRWKKVQVIDSVMGPWHKALLRYREGNLESGSVLGEGNGGSCRGH